MFPYQIVRISNNKTDNWKQNNNLTLQLQVANYSCHYVLRRLIAVPNIFYYFNEHDHHVRVHQRNQSSQAP